eukprot:CAMPEP_0182427312 /NCGR_PEP_ID=MMETSP1167-20130531/17021_1 /TAXON_ID=2988 /ORGANISM="Mallomonas Sp, Strain CCMP3275" /LENGTH=344 /DNA_ID=CAMNT_0024609451 /DNA_START=100 /DNA_END=1134 /DNA_ORIENTATION=+
MSELRQRNTASKSSTEGTAAVAEKYVESLASASPDAIKPYLEKMGPVIGKIINFIEKEIIPLFYILYKKYTEISVMMKPYHLDLLTPAFFGLILCFFGGSYLTLIAAVEAYRISAWSGTSKAARDLYATFESCVEADKKDNQVDEDKDGRADVLDMSGEAVLHRKLSLFAKTVDPDTVTLAIKAISSGFMAVIATLKLRFAAALTLGTSIGEVVDRPAQKYLTPLLHSVLPEEFKRWASYLVSYAVRSTCISLSWVIQRVISAFHSSIRGGHMISRNIIDYLDVMNIYHINPNDTIADEVVGYGLAVIGFLFQLSYGFQLPLILSILMFPFSIAEYFLLWAMSY